MRPISLAAFPIALLLACGGSHAPQTAAAPTTGASAATTAPAGATPAAAAAASTPATTTAAASTEVTVGQVAPDFTTTDQDGKPLHLADLKGHSVVVYFYPKDETPGCTKEACSFRDAWADLQKKGVIVIGVSIDTADSHKAFAKNHQLPFTLVSDPKGEIAAKYGVPMDKDAGYIHRQSFVVAPDGTVKKIYRKVDVTVHAQQIAQDTAS